VFILVEVGCFGCLISVVDCPNIFVGVLVGWNIIAWVCASSHCICFRFFSDIVEEISV